MWTGWRDRAVWDEQITRKDLDQWPQSEVLRAWQIPIGSNGGLELFFVFTHPGRNLALTIDKAA